MTPGAALEAPRVILVDDEAQVRRSVRFLLEVEGILVVGEAGDGAEAVALCGRVAPDVVVMDVRMPVMNGLEATRQLRRVAPATRVVIFTAYDSAALERQALEAGAYACAAKGCSGDDLVAAVRKAYEAGGAQQPSARQRAQA